jgi:ATP-dependent helicase HrpA
LSRHLFQPEVEQWAEARGVLVKAIEDVALGTASVYRTLELPLPAKLPQARSRSIRAFRELIAQFMPFDLVIDEHTSDGRPARISRGSVCTAWGAVAGSIRYFADSKGVARAAIEGTTVPLELIRRYAQQGPAEVEFRDDRRYVGLVVTRRTEYFGFELDRSRSPLEGAFPTELAGEARDALAKALIENLTPHPDQRGLTRALARLDEYWRRSGGRLPEASPDARWSSLRGQLEEVNSWSDFVGLRFTLDPDQLLPSATRAALDSLPTSLPLEGDRVTLAYEMENGNGVAVLYLREGQARRLRTKDLPALDRPMRFAISHGRSVFKAESLDDVQRALRSLPRDTKPGKHRKHRRGRRRG